MDEALTGSGVQELGGWKTFPYVLGGVAGVSMGYQGLLSNLLVYLIKQYHLNNADATQILSVVNGCIQFASILCAVVADAIGCFYVVYVAVVACFLVNRYGIHVYREGDNGRTRQLAYSLASLRAR